MEILFAIYMLIGYFSALLAMLIEEDTGAAGCWVFICTCIWPFFYAILAIYIICSTPMFIANKVSDYNTRLKRSKRPKD